MANHPIEGLMRTAMESIKQMVDVNTIVGEAVETPDGSVVIPITKVLCGFAAGGGDFTTDEEQKNDKANSNSKNNGKEVHPFGGGSGAGVSVQPVGFLVVGNGDVRLMSVDGGTAVEKLIDLTPRVLSQIQETWLKQNKKARTMTKKDEDETSFI